MMSNLDVFLTQNEERLWRVYEASPSRIREDFGREETVLAGGYGYRQVLELVQNGADAVLQSAHDGAQSSSTSRLRVLLTGQYLYVANTGAPLTEEGLESLLASDISPKRDNQIGRFGLGFKSLLALGGRVDIFTSDRGTIHFDPARCRKTIAARFGVEAAPGMRLAWFGPAADTSDPNLATMTWAETVVRAEVGNATTFGRLKNEIEEFPAEFLLFFESPLTIDLEIEGETPNLLSVERFGNRRTLHHESKSSEWWVFDKVITVTDKAAQEDARGIHRRDKVPISWAVPEARGRDSRGHFWAFFPTKTPTQISGVLNAPWKLNSDRNSIVSGDWNTLLMAEAAKLIVDSYPYLCTVDDPARALDSFPNADVGHDDLALPLVTEVWAKIASERTIPDGIGKLRDPSNLLLFPALKEGAGILPVPVLSSWCELVTRDERERYAHPMCYRGVRWSKLRLLRQKLSADHPGSLASPTLVQWAELKSVEIEQFGHVNLAFLRSLLEVLEGPASKDLLQNARLVPDASGVRRRSTELVLADQGKLPEGYFGVLPSLLTSPDCVRIMADVLDIQYPGPELQLKQIEILRKQGQWTKFWEAFSDLPATYQSSYLESDGVLVKVPDRVGTWRWPDDVLLPGAVVQDVDENASVLVDAIFARKYERILKRVGLTNDHRFDELSYFSPTELKRSEVLKDWEGECGALYRSTYKNFVHNYYVRQFALPRGWHLLERCGADATRRLTSIMLTLVAKKLIPGSVGFKPAGGAYPELTVPHPIVSLLMRCGRVMVTGVDLSLRLAVARIEVLRIVELAPPELGGLEASWLGLDFKLFDVSQAEFLPLWKAIAKTPPSERFHLSSASPTVWSQAAADGYVPEALPFRGTEVPMTQILVTSNLDAAKHSYSLPRLVVHLSEDTLPIWTAKGATRLEEVQKPLWKNVVGPTMKLLEVYPELGDFLAEESADGLLYKPVEGLMLSLAGQNSPVPVAFEDQTTLVDLKQCEVLGARELLVLIVELLDGLGWFTEDARTILDKVANSRQLAFFERLSSARTLAERLLLLVHGKPECLGILLSRTLPPNLVERVSTLERAQLFLALHGPNALRELSEYIEVPGVDVPTRWAGARARSFVSTLGFPEVFGAARAGRREPEILVEGPYDLPPLHDYQNEILDTLTSEEFMGKRNARAIVSLPTGGGKTRVVVQLAVQSYLHQKRPDRTVLWIAQSDELCEQATESFAQIWSKNGSPESLRVCRLWGSQDSPRRSDSSRPTVVVASIQTLNVRLDDEELGWLKSPGLVVVDECHRAVSSSYTRLLRWLDGSKGPTILGLSATPFRSDPEESKWLANRFGKRIIPGDQEGLHQRLLRMGALASTEYLELQTESQLTEEEARSLGTVDWNNRGIELERISDQINTRLAVDPDRNELIVASIERAQGKSTLVFANSVPHAMELAALLTLRGVNAASISADTPSQARRYFLDEFRSGRIQVLCNYDVLSTGFDAPKTDLVVISRQVFSPVRYQQMVGRGLRGPKNGGKEVCRVVTLVDNLGRFSEKLAYHYWRRFYV
ncbi:MAG: DEAD/DEAH box helicase family protein [Spirochaetales bacterium]